MMERKVSLALLVVWVLAVCWMVSLYSPSQSQAREVVVVEGSGFDTSSSLTDNLKRHTGKDVFVHLKSGKTLQGYVKSVGSNLLHLEKLAGKDFYDALIRIEEISAMEAKFRELK